jgi:hypothetical protein
MTSTITLITGEGSVRVYGDNLVLDLRSQTATEYGHVESSVSHASSAVEFGATNSVCQGGNGPLAPVLSATEEQRACGNGPDHFETPAELPRQQVDRAGEVEPLPASPATSSGAILSVASGSDEHLPEKKLVVNPAKVIRKHCQQPELCRSGTRDHCHTCKKAMAENEVAA